jgi:hypothetical protein
MLQTLKLNNEKGKKSSFSEEKSFVELTPDFQRKFFEDEVILKSHLIHHLRFNIVLIKQINKNDVKHILILFYFNPVFLELLLTYFLAKGIASFNDGPLINTMTRFRLPILNATPFFK